MRTTFTVVGLAFLIGGTAAQAQSLRAELLATPLTKNLGGAGTRAAAEADAYGLAVGNITPQHRALFTFGTQVFTAEWKPAPGAQVTTDGLGPLFHRDSCRACHLANGRGRAPETSNDLLETMLIRMSVPGEAEHGAPKGVPNYGDQLQDRGIDGVPPEGRARVSWAETKGSFGDGAAFSLHKPTFAITDLNYGPLPANAMLSPRVANPMPGLGLLESVPDATLIALADPDDQDKDGISGRVNRVWDAPSQSMKVGRFGWKANVASLAHQNAGAARGDMGISTPVFPADACEPSQAKCLAAVKASAAVTAQQLAEIKTATEEDAGLEMTQAFFDRLQHYVRFLAVPEQRGAERVDVQRGEKLFRDTGCASCHMPTLKIGAEATTPEFANQIIHPFTDLLVHDMGEGLADGRPDYLASGTEWRTPPLWGLGLTEKVSGFTFLLHDGRARNVTEAILWHGGEGEASKERFRAMPKAQRDELLAFLNSL